MEWNIRNLDTNKMLINPLNPNLVGFMESNIPQLKSIEIEYKEKTFTKSMLYRYVLLMYDENSPIQQRQSLDWFEKKYEAVGYSGFPLKKERDGYMRFDERVNNMVLGKEDAINDIIVEFIAWTNKSRWGHIIFLKEAMLGLIRDALGRKVAGARSSAEMRKLYDDYMRIVDEVSHQKEETEDFISRFYYKIEQSRMAIRTEDYAKRLSTGDDLRADNPYGVNYVVDKIKFLGDDEITI